MERRSLNLPFGSTRTKLASNERMLIEFMAIKRDEMWVAHHPNSSLSEKNTQENTNYKLLAHLITIRVKICRNNGGNIIHTFECRW